LIDPWRGMEPYSDDEIAKKPCGPPTKFKIPSALQECVLKLFFLVIKNN